MTTGLHCLSSKKQGAYLEKEDSNYHQTPGGIHVEEGWSIQLSAKVWRREIGFGASLSFSLHPFFLLFLALRWVYCWGKSCLQQYCSPEPFSPFLLPSDECSRYSLSIFCILASLFTCSMCGRLAGCDRWTHTQWQLCQCASAAPQCERIEV